MAGKKPAPPLSTFGGPTNFTTPAGFAVAVRNVANVVRATPADLVKTGQEWYPKVHEAAQKATRGPKGGRRNVTLEQNAGIIAATSPNMDFEKTNIHALDEIHKIKGSAWKEVERSAASGGRRTPGAQAALAGLSIAANTDHNLLKAHRILRGEEIDDVLDPITSPKTNSFAKNIIDPHGESFKGLTIDGRAHDIARNQMLPWGTTRAIGGSRPNRARYDDFVKVHHAAREVVQETLGIHAPGPAIQAIPWVGAKHIERQITGGKQGPARRGQPYV